MLSSLLASARCAGFRSFKQTRRGARIYEMRAIFFSMNKVAERVFRVRRRVFHANEEVANYLSTGQWNFLKAMPVYVSEAAEG